MAQSRISRRQFLKRATVTSLAVPGFPYVVSGRVLGAAGGVAPSTRITLGFIGTGNQGTNNLKGFLQLDDVQVVAVCDVNRASYGYKTAKQYLGREPGRKIVNDHYAEARAGGTFKGCDACIDFRRIIDRDDIDAVVITVPDQWHAVMSIMAARAGKDIYCEKPMTLAIAEGNHMIRAVRRFGTVFQTGSHERSNYKSRFACELVRNGYIGDLKRIITTVGPNNKTAPPSDWKPMPVPDGFDYNMWLGPAPFAPYHKDRCLYSFRFGADYSGGQTTNYGAHCNDLAQWANDTELSGPVEIEDLGAEWPTDGLFTTATKVHFRALYANGVELICKTGPENMQVRFEGTEGWIQHGYRGSSCYPENLWKVTLSPNDVRLGDSTNHYRNFIDCIKSRTDPCAPVEIGHRSATVCHLGNIAMKLKRKLTWDPQAERFTNNEQANRVLEKPLRSPWHL
jgi:predicted dehydrogenase